MKNMEEKTSSSKVVFKGELLDVRKDRKIVWNIGT